LIFLYLPAVCYIVTQINHAYYGGYLCPGADCQNDKNDKSNKKLFPVIDTAFRFPVYVTPQQFPVEIKDVKYSRYNEKSGKDNMKGGPLGFTQSKYLPVGPVGDAARRGYVKHDPGDYAYQEGRHQQKTYKRFEIK
jgi:hypothetical protein